jgi:trimeric autotransporter adhesin
MKPRLFFAVVLSLGVVSWAQGQERRPVSEPQEPRDRGPAFATASGRLSQDNEAAVPRLLKFSGVLTDLAGKPLSGEVEVTFVLYKLETDEEPLWKEAQKVEADKEGGYTALLGATQPGGIPSELFRSDEARWLGVRVEGQPEQPRILLVSVPYALKAVEAEKLAGKSVSDFVLSDNLGDQVRRVIEGQTIVAGQATATGALQQGQTKPNSALSPQTTSAGPMFPPSTFSGTNGSQIVLVQQNGSGNGVVGQTASSTGASGVVGIATSTSTSSNQNGVYGQNAGAGAGVAGIATSTSAGVGVYGQGSNFAGVFGSSMKTSGFAAGVYGQTPSTDGAGVHGNNTAATGFATGVTGFSASTNGNGVFGNASATSGFANGVFGQTASPGGNGVLGISNALSGFNSGVFGQSASANGTGVFGTSVQWVGVGGQATASSGGPAFGVWGDSLSTGGTGVAGFEDATSGFTNGVFGQSVSPNGNGVFGVNNAATGGNGVVGVANATSGGANGVLGSINSTSGAGVLGVSNATSGDARGALGVSASADGSGVFGANISSTGGVGVRGQTDGANGIAVWGAYGFGPTPGGGVGVKGSIEAGAANGVAGQFINVPGQGLLLQGISGNSFQQVFSVDTAGNLQISGNLIIGGTKSSTAKLQDGREVALYAVESPENWFEDFGSAELKNGVAWVPLDASFAQTINAAVSYHVFLTANGDSNGLYVARKTAAGFEIREHGGGTSNVAFDYRIVAKRRGYEAIRMLQVPEQKALETFHPPLKMANRQQQRAEPDKITPPVAPAAIRPVPRPVVPAQAVPPAAQIPKMNVPQQPKPR